MSPRVKHLWQMFSGAIVLISVLALSAYVFLEIPTLRVESSVVHNLGFFVLININIVVLMVLGFMVIKNLVKLFLDRRNKLLGSKLRARLVGAFVALSLIPTVLLFFVSKGILDRVLQGWFSPQVQASVDGAVGVSKLVYESEEARMDRSVRYVAEEIARITSSFKSRVGGGLIDNLHWQEILEHYLQRKRAEYGLFQLAVMDSSGTVYAKAEDREVSAVDVPAVNQANVHQALSGTVLVRPEQSLNGQFMRGYAPLVAEKLNVRFPLPLEEYCVVATHFVKPEMNELFSTVVAAYDDYRELSTYRRPLASSYILTLLVFTVMVVFAAIWVGFYLAKGLTVPILNLAEGTAQVAHGNLDHQIPEVGDDELSILVRSFNKMTMDLKETTTELVTSRRYMETLLASVEVGVVSVDQTGKVTTINRAAAAMLDLRNGEGGVNKDYRRIFPRHSAEKITEMLKDLTKGDPQVLTGNVELSLRHEARQVQVTMTKLMDQAERPLGAVILLEDLTELFRAQRMAAWQEVARRIAHEIKNPLTPIQLSAQRLERKFRHADLEDRGLIVESCEIILHQVETLRRLVDEFSRFARMPKASPKTTDLNELLFEVVSIARESYPRVAFGFSPDKLLPPVELDREQMNQVLMNIIDNAVSAVLEREKREPQQGSKPGLLYVLARTREIFGIGKGDSQVHGFVPRVKIASTYNKVVGLASVEISDNGVGISDSDKAKLFEPYFTKKEGGTGLGLAIVSSIVSDHHGFIRVRDNQDEGTTFVLELPLLASARAEVA